MLERLLELCMCSFTTGVKLYGDRHQYIHGIIEFSKKQVLRSPVYRGSMKVTWIE